MTDEEELAHQLRGAEKNAEIAENLAALGYTPAQLVELLLLARSVIGLLGQIAGDQLAAVTELGDPEGWHQLLDKPDDNEAYVLADLLRIHDIADHVIESGGIAVKEYEDAFLIYMGVEIKEEGT